MTQLRTLVVDDEPLARKGLMVRLKDCNDIDIIGECSNGQQAIDAIKLQRPDLVFLDIQMPGLNGFDVVQNLTSANIDMPMVVFVTAFDQYAIKAFDVRAIDYMLKPVDMERLQQAIDTVKSALQQKQAGEHKQKLAELVSEVTGNDCQQILQDLASNTPVSISNYSDVLAIKDVGETTLVPTKEIVCIDAAGDYMCVHTHEGTHILRKTMKELEELLDPKHFLRIHRSSIVNRNFIDKFGNNVNGEYYLILTNQKELKVSRSYKDKVKQAVLGS
ncbi:MULTISPECIES: LytTR family DNA-binding domain-containing protein [unclassified Thalassotalea]|uniref:LytR/AlgR family response regulator transcription factor n=1 Tax=unclassified Thalassotalea TaxID=2614972 RepID=UPI00108132E1|nr:MULTISPECIES: LytTR family DNA-binding domain-containing protein [unclassified Thalassotalea]NMP15282.1 response regulator transcription factor [Thalassotalea sp. Y01]QBY06070.1 response regulator transcription factor [Thalassotalea sp. HSM 43]